MRLRGMSLGSRASPGKASLSLGATSHDAGSSLTEKANEGQRLAHCNRTLDLCERCCKASRCQSRCPALHIQAIMRSKCAASR